MIHRIIDWIDGDQVERDATSEEAADIEARKVAHDPVISKRESLIWQVNAECDRRIGTMVESYPRYEIETFGKQEAEARTYLSQSNIPTPLLDELAASRGIDKSILSNKIVEKADFFAAQCGKIIGHRQKLETQIAVADAAALALINPSAGWPA